VTSPLRSERLQPTVMVVKLGDRDLVHGPVEQPGRDPLAQASLRPASIRRRRHSHGPGHPAASGSQLVNPGGRRPSSRSASAGGTETLHQRRGLAEVAPEPDDLQMLWMVTEHAMQHLGGAVARAVVDDQHLEVVDASSSTSSISRRAAADSEPRCRPDHNRDEVGVAA